ncbi:beta family protein [Streptomyces sp. YS-3]|uniref:beta family protein n=1 Tax=Streptomyces sp. YS-3 TaxID=3381352 RepID=UPI0038626C8F
MAENTLFRNHALPLTLVRRDEEQAVNKGGRAAMSEPLYVPALPARPHAADAYRRLRPDIQRAVAPLWSLPLRPGLLPSELESMFRGDLEKVTKAQRYHPAWLDAPFADESQLPVLEPLLSGVIAVAPLRPVTGPERPRAQQTWALETARRSGDGLGIRVRMAEGWGGGDVVERVRDLLARADLAVRVDLLLDLVAVLADRPDAGKEALRALDALVSLAPWRTVAVIGGGMPALTAELMDQGLHDEPRTDWTLWCETAESGRPYLSLLTYGDYGIQAASDLARVPQGKGGPPWGALRYTTDRSFVIVKMLARGEGHATNNRFMARHLLDSPGFRKPSTSAGEAWIRDCAQGSGGTGTFSTWLWVGNAQHMTYVVQSLRAMGAP